MNYAIRDRYLCEKTVVLSLHRQYHPTLPQFILRIQCKRRGPFRKK